MQQSLGFVECDGLSGALVAADRMLKTANVKLEGIQQNIGINWVNIKISGDISAVSVAIDAVKQTMPKIYVTSVVLGSPATGINTLGRTNIDLFKSTLGKKSTATKAASSAAKSPVSEASQTRASANTTVASVAVASSAGKAPTSASSAVPTSSTASAGGQVASSATTSEQTSTKSDDADDSNDDSSNASDEKVTCNLCGDPKCPRKIGEPHKKCIHYNELKNKK